jgi:hypothetical protein
VTAHSGIEVPVKYHTFSGFLGNASLYVFAYTSIFRLVAKMASYAMLEMIATLPDVLRLDRFFFSFLLLFCCEWDIYRLGLCSIVGI